VIQQQLHATTMAIFVDICIGIKAQNSFITKTKWLSIDVLFKEEKSRKDIFTELSVERGRRRQGEGRKNVRFFSSLSKIHVIKEKDLTNDFFSKLISLLFIVERDIFSKSFTLMKLHLQTVLIDMPSFSQKDNSSPIFFFILFVMENKKSNNSRECLQDLTNFQEKRDRKKQ
jgi:hypothetical protein